MKLETAIKVLKKESEWLGMKMPDLLEDIANNRYRYTPQGLSKHMMFTLL